MGCKMLTIVMCIFVSQVVADQPEFYAQIQEINPIIARMMTGYSWQPECPIPLEDLRYVTVAHWGYDGKVHAGHIIVHSKLAQEIVDIFQELFAEQFPIERIQIIDTYAADDIRSMEANNSSAFCYRPNTTHPTQLSNHSYGIAIDINPKVNPYVKGDLVLPPSGRAYLDRTKDHQGMIAARPDNVCYQAFTKRGYAWGGECLPGRTDYQHFSKDKRDIGMS